MTRKPAKNPAASIRALACSIPEPRAKITSESWADMLSSGFCIGWTVRPTATDSQLKEQAVHALDG